MKTTWRSKPTIIEAVQWTGDYRAVRDFAGMKIDMVEQGTLLLLAGTNGAQGWVTVPTGHWLVCQAGDLSDIWPVDPDYFAEKYEPCNVEAS
jgi:hypothetical protein